MKKIYSLMLKGQGGKTVFIESSLFILIVINVLAVILESVQGIYEPNKRLFNFLEVFSVVVFTIEYLVRIWLSIRNSRSGKEFVGFARFLTSFPSLIDLLSILPFYLPFIGIDLRFLRMLRLLRIFRMLKVARYLKAVNVIGDVLKKKREELVVSILLLMFLLLGSSSLVYFMENDTQPDKFSSIPQTMWWGISTLTTVGYGDVYPITTGGKVLGGIVSFLGVILFALPAGIIASGFINEVSGEKLTCPNCGKHF